MVYWPKCYRAKQAEEASKAAEEELQRQQQTFTALQGGFPAAGEEAKAASSNETPGSCFHTQLQRLSKKYKDRGNEINRLQQHLTEVKRVLESKATAEKVRLWLFQVLSTSSFLIIIL